MEQTEIWAQLAIIALNYIFVSTISATNQKQTTNVNKDCISKACRGLHQTAGGLHWQYYNKGA